jgi:hypothetical protein
MQQPTKTERCIGMMVQQEGSLMWCRALVRWHDERGQIKVMRHDNQQMMAQ